MTIHSYQLLSGAEPVLHRLATEARFARSGQFYSQLGPIISTIEEKYPEWLVGGEGVRAHEVTFVSIADGTEVSLSDLGYRVVLTGRNDRRGYEVDDVISYSRNCEFIDDFYRSRVDPSEFLRFGFRHWWYFYFENEDLAHEWIRRTGLFNAGPLEREFEGHPIKSSYVGVFAGEKRDVRISLSVVEFAPELEREEQINSIKTHTLSEKQQAALIRQQKMAASRIRRGKTFAAAIDFDSYQEFPSKELDVGAFVRDESRELITKIRAASTEAESS